MRKWLVETTGDERQVRNGEYYLFDEIQNSFPFHCWRGTEQSGGEYPILRVTEITDQQFFLVDEFTGKQHGGPYKWEETAVLARSQLENRSPDEEWNLQITTKGGD